MLSGLAQPTPRPIEQQRELTEQLSNWINQRIGDQNPGPLATGSSSPSASPQTNSPQPAVPDFRSFVEPWRIGRDSSDKDVSNTAEVSTPGGKDDDISVASETSVDSSFHVDSPAPQTNGESVAVAEVATPATSIPPTSLNAPALGSSVRAMQVHDCYLIVETSEGVTVIDQHALHERIVYEHLRARVLAGAVESQRLLVPQQIEVTPKEAALLLEQSESLQKAGLGLEDFGNGTVIVTGYPAMLRKMDLQGLVRDLIEKLEGGGTVGVQSSARRDILDELLHMMSCKAAVKAGQRLTQEEIESLLLQRHLVDDAHHCPHGRPTALSLSRMELDRQFGRLG